MLEDITIIEGESVRAIKWLSDAHKYDLSLHALGQGLDSFIVLNPWVENSAYHYIDTVPKTDQCIIWNYQGHWVAKHFNQDWTPKKGYTLIELEQTQVMWNQNPAFDATLKFKNDPISKFTVDPWDSQYKLTWYVNEDYNPTDDKVWAITATPVGRSVAGIKDMGYLTPVIPEKLDVIFISYDEPNAEENWQRVLEKAPWAKRVAGVTGILEAHKAAAKLARTYMFYVVDGDAWLTDDWEFDFQPSIFNRDCVYVWRSENPVNRLIYGYGGVKLFPTNLLKKTRHWGTDLTTSINNKFKIIDQISNITRFNTSEYATWRSSFRECVKLAISGVQESKEKLESWLKPKANADYAEWSRIAAEQAIAFVNTGNDVNLINDYDWMNQQFINNYSNT